MANNIDNKKFGVPQQNKFPLTDADHVRSAIRFFNYVEPKYEMELARAILKRAREYGVDLSEINIGDNNRFKKYMPNELRHSRSHKYISKYFKNGKWHYLYNKAKHELAKKLYDEWGMKEYKDLKIAEERVNKARREAAENGSLFSQKIDQTMTDYIHKQKAFKRTPLGQLDTAYKRVVNAGRQFIGDMKNLVVR